MSSEGLRSEDVLWQHRWVHTTSIARMVPVGAGKTYTLSNTQPSAIGMIPRAVAEIFKKAAEDTLHR